MFAIYPYAWTRGRGAIAPERAPRGRGRVRRGSLGVWLVAALGALVIAADLLTPLMAGQAPRAAEGLAVRQALALQHQQRNTVRNQGLVEAEERHRQLGGAAGGEGSDEEQEAAAGGQRPGRQPAGRAATPAGRQARRRATGTPGSGRVRGGAVRGPTWQCQHAPTWPDVACMGTPPFVSQIRVFNAQTWKDKFIPWPGEAKDYADEVIMQAYSEVSDTYTAAALMASFTTAQLQGFAADPAQHFKLRVLNEAFKLGGKTTLAKWPVLHGLVEALPPNAAYAPAQLARRRGPHTGTGHAPTGSFIGSGGGERPTETVSGGLPAGRG